MNVAVHLAAALDVFGTGSFAKGRRNKYSGLESVDSFSLERGDAVTQRHFDGKRQAERRPTLRSDFNSLPRDAGSIIAEFMHSVSGDGDVALKGLIPAAVAPGVKRVAAVNVAFVLLGMNDEFGYSVLSHVAVVGDGADVIHGGVDNGAATVPAHNLLRAIVPAAGGGMREGRGDTAGENAGREHDVACAHGGCREIAYQISCTILPARDTVSANA